jgi:large subunit ribosomal protein L22
MEVKASHRFARIAPGKVRPVANLVRGLGVNESLETLRRTRRRASPMISKVIRAAIAAAGESHSVDAEDLYVKTIRIDDGPRRRAIIPRPRGMWARIYHRTCHISLILADAEENAD